MREIRRVREYQGKAQALILALIIAAATFGLTSTAQAKEDFQAYWDNGLRFKSDNVSVSMGGRVMFDTMWGAGNADFERNLNAGGPFIDGFEFRRLRLYSAGEINKSVSWKVEVDFAGGGVAIKDSVVAFEDVFLGTSFSFGNQKEPFSLEEMTSSRHTTFMERSLMNNFAPGYNPGLLISNTDIADGMFTVALGIFRPGEGEGAVAGPGATEDGEYSITGRITAAPILEDKGKTVVHLGFSYRFLEDPDNGGTLDEFRFRARPGTHATGSRYVNTGAFDASKIQNLVLELAAQFSILSVQGEYLISRVDYKYPLAGPNGTGEPKFYSWYVQVSAFATGEFRPYKKGKFDRVKPDAELGRDGIGAIEIAFRIDSINLTDRAEGIAGGNEVNYTLGVNWYMTPNTRIMVNGILCTFDELVGPGLKEGTLKVAQARFQADF